MQSGMLSGVMIQDERNPQEIATIFAETGSVDMDEKQKKIHLHLFDGSIHHVTPARCLPPSWLSKSMIFDRPFQKRRSLEKNELDMSLAELRQNLKKGGFSKKMTLEMGIEVHRRFAMPFACFIFAIVAVPLGIQNRRSGKAAGFSLSIITLLVYYILQSLGKSLGEKSLLPLALAVWLPNIIFLSGGIYLFVKAAREESIWLFDRGSALLAHVLKWYAGR